MRKLIFFFMVLVSYSAIMPRMTKSTRTGEQDYTQNYLYFFSNDPKVQAISAGPQQCNCLKASLRVYCITCDKAGKYCYESFCNYKPNIDPWWNKTGTQIVANTPQDPKKLTSEEIVTKQIRKYQMSDSSVDGESSIKKPSPSSIECDCPVRQATALCLQCSKGFCPSYYCSLIPVYPLISETQDQSPKDSKSDLKSLKDKVATKVVNLQAEKFVQDRQVLP